MDPGNFKVQLALKEIRIVFLLLSSSYSLLLMAVGFYMYVCVCVCVHACMHSLVLFFEHLPKSGYCSMCSATQCDHDRYSLCCHRAYNS